MTKLKPEVWKGAKEVEMLQFFSLLVEDLLFDYNLSSYRRRLLNTKDLCREFIEHSNTILDNDIPRKSYIHILDELKYSLKRDPAAKKLLGSIFQSTLTDLSEYENNLEDLINIVDVIHNLLGEQYYETLKNMIIDRVLNNTNKKSDFELLTQLMLSELISKGYSQRHIYLTNSYLFKGKNSQISSSNGIYTFFNRFTFEKHKYRVVLRSKEISSIRDAFEDTQIKILSELPEPFSTPTNAEFIGDFASEGFEFIIPRSVYAMDQESAKDMVEQQMTVFESFIHYNYHQINLLIDNTALVCEESDEEKEQKVYRIDERTPPLFKQGDRRSEEIKQVTRETFGRLGSLEDAEVMISAIISHSDALRTKNQSHQLLTLWSNIETISSSLMEARGIANISRAITPPIVLNYFLNHIFRLYTELKSQHRHIFESTIHQIDVDTEDWQLKLIHLLLSHKYLTIRKELYKNIAPSNPLLVYRLYDFSTVLNSKKSIKEKFLQHIQNVHWQIERIYRARNDIVHAGRHDVNTLEGLLENLHEYFDLIINSIFRYSDESHGMRSVKAIFAAQRRFLDQYIRDLSGTNESPIREENIKLFLDPGRML